MVMELQTEIFIIFVVEVAQNATELNIVSFIDLVYLTVCLMQSVYGS